MENISLTAEMIAVLVILGVTVLMFVTEIFRIDFSAILIMVSLGVLSQMPGLGGLADPSHLFDGFSSNAVISIIAVMIIGAGLDKTGLMSKVAGIILKYGGSTEQRIIPIISGSVGIISSFMQNVGAAALFLPVISRISVRTELPLSRLLMPMGFCAILGGTMTMVGSSPLILLNDLIITANSELPPGSQMETFGLFAVTPVGVCLVMMGIVYFVVFGRWVLPSRKSDTDGASGVAIRDYVRNLYGVDSDIFEVAVPENCGLQGQAILSAMLKHNVYIIGTHQKGDRFFAPVLTTEIECPCRFAVLGERSVVEKMAAEYGADVLPKLDVFAEDYSATTACLAP